MTENDQPRPDLDAAVDAVLPSLTAVSDDAVAASLRRTRVALAETRSSRVLTGWRWGAAATAAALIVLASALALWRSRAPEPGSIVERPANPLIVAPPLAPSSPPVAPEPVVPQHVARAEPGSSRPERRRAVPVHATSAPPLSAAPRTEPDPVLALARALEAIPESAWLEATARTSAPIGAAELSVAPIVVPPLVTPPITDPPAPPVQGEP